MVRRFLLMITFLTSATCGVAEAYLLPAGTVIHKASQVLEKQAGCNLSLKGTLQRDDEVHPINAHWSFAQKSQIQFEDQNGQKVIWSPGSKPPPDPHQLLPHASVLQVLHLLFGRAELKTVILQHGIDKTQQRLGLHGTTVAHVVGARLPASRNSQIWLDQENFVITRIRFSDAGHDMDLELKNWNGPMSKGRFPQDIIIRMDGRERHHLRVTTFRGKGD